MGPWTRDKYGKVIDANGNQVTLTGFASWCGYVEESLHKDDDDVFRAVNSHDDLVAALKSIAKLTATKGMDHTCRKVCSLAIDAVAKAEGGK